MGVVPRLVWAWYQGWYGRGAKVGMGVVRPEACLGGAGRLTCLQPQPCAPVWPVKPPSRSSMYPLSTLCQPSVNPLSARPEQPLASCNVLPAEQQHDAVAKRAEGTRGQHQPHLPLCT